MRMRAAMSGAARAPMLQLKLRNVRSGAHRAGYARPTKSVTRGHGNADADAEEQKRGRKQRAGADGHSKARTDHCGEADGDETRIAATA